MALGEQSRDPLRIIVRAMTLTQAPDAHNKSLAIYPFGKDNEAFLMPFGECPSAPKGTTCVRYAPVGSQAARQPFAERRLYCH